MKNFFAAVVLVLSTFLVAVFFWLPTKYVVPVIMYHQIAETSKEPLNTVSPETFAKHMAYLKDKGYRVISADEYVRKTEAGEPFHLNTVVITFDDGFENNYHEAYPVLKEYGYPALIFMPSDNVAKPGRLTWGQLREMADNGIAIGSHMRTEAYVPDLTGAALVDEIAGSKMILEKNLDRPVFYISYPIGGFTEEAKDVTRKAGYHAAFATNRGEDKANKDLFEINRIRLKETDPPIVLMVKLSGYYNLLRKTKASH